MTGAGPRRRRAALPLAVAAITMPNLLRHGPALGEAWPIWRAILVQAALVFAGGLAVAALALGATARRRART